MFAKRLFDIVFSLLGLIVFSPLLLIILTGCGAEIPDRLQIGDPAPPFAVRSLEGKDISLGDYRGKPVVLRFFLVDCKYCRADTPVLNDYYARYEAKGLRVIYIAPQGINQKTVEDFAGELHIAFPVALDPTGEIAASYRVKALPQTIVLSPDHKIIAALLGGVSEAELNRLLSPYVQ
ncbi:MAG: redoxin domain-containing protein [Thermodesulfobacteriota bacterium]